MNLKKINLIIGREYSVRVKKKSFILTTILTPILFALLITVPSMIMLMGNNDEEKILVLDESGVVSPYLESSKTIDYSFAEGVSMESLKARFDTLGIYALIDISPLDENSNVNVTSYSREPLSYDIKSDIEKGIGNAIQETKLKQYDIENLDSILADIKTDVSINAITITKNGGEKKDNVTIYMAISYIMSFMIYMFIALFGSMVMRGVIEEKSSRIVEVIVSSVNSFELMMGKIIGVAAVAFTQFVIWILLTVGLVFGIGVVAGGSLSAPAQPDLTAQMVDSASSLTGVGDTAVVDGASTNAFLQDILSQLGGINYLQLIVCFLIYFFLGYLLYAAMYAAVGSAVDNEADTQQLSLPVTIPLVIGLFIMLHAFQHPGSQLSIWASIIPFTSPMVMLARIPFGVVPAWELILSIGVLIFTFIAVAYFSAKIYKVGILTYGKKASFKDLMKWIKYKN